MALLFRRSRLTIRELVVLMDNNLRSLIQGLLVGCVRVNMSLTGLVGLGFSLHWRTDNLVHVVNLLMFYLRAVDDHLENIILLILLRKYSGIFLTNFSPN